MTAAFKRADPTAAPVLLIVEDHSLVRESLLDLLGQHFAPITLWEADSLAQALDRVSVAVPEVILLDLNLHDASGLMALGRMRDRCPTSAIVVLSGTADQSLAPLVLAMGADACIFKTGRRQVLLEVLAPLLRDGDASHRARRSLQGERRSLTPQQLTVLDLLLAGRSNKEIARHTGLAQGTVRNYVSALLGIFGVDTRSQLLALFGS